MSGTAEYLLAFSSFYRATYAQETLAGQGIHAAVRKLPPGLLSSCGYGITLRTDGTEGLKRALRLLEEKDIRNKGVFAARREQGKMVYERIFL